MRRTELVRWRRKRFPADTEKASRELAADWYGVKSRRAWEHWEQGTRPIPQALANRIEADTYATEHCHGQGVR